LKAGGLEGFEAVAAELESLDDDALWPFRDEAWRRQQGHDYGAPPPVHNYAHTVHSILHHILRCCPAMASGSAAVATVRAGLRADYAAVLTDADLAVMVGLASKYSPAPATAATPCDLPVLSLRIFEHMPQNGPERLMFEHLVELACAALEKSTLHGVSLVALRACLAPWLALQLIEPCAFQVNKFVSIIASLDTLNDDKAIARFAFVNGAATVHTAASPDAKQPAVRGHSRGAWSAMTTAARDRCFKLVRSRTDLLVKFLTYVGPRESNLRIVVLPDIFNERREVYSTSQDLHDAKLVELLRTGFTERLGSTRAAGQHNSWRQYGAEGDVIMLWVGGEGKEEGELGEDMSALGGNCACDKRLVAVLATCDSASCFSHTHALMVVTRMMVVTRRHVRGEPGWGQDRRGRVVRVHTGAAKGCRGRTARP
jgi:hypothetical protein